MMGKERKAMTRAEKIKKRLFEVEFVKKKKRGEGDKKILIKKK